MRCFDVEEFLIPDFPLIVIVGLLVGGRNEDYLEYRG